MHLCHECFFLEGHCRHLQAKLVSDAELGNPDFVADVKRYAHAQGLPCDQWQDYLIGLYRDYPGTIIDRYGLGTALNSEHLDASRYWYRDFCKPVPPGVTPRIRREARERVRVMATILRAADPAGTRLWGVRAANDAPGPSFKLKGAEVDCPYKDGKRPVALLWRSARSPE